MNKEFKFPEKWYIQWENRENYKIISSHFKKHKDTWIYEDDDIHSAAGVNYKNQYFNNHLNFQLKNISDCTKITIEQFKKYVLKLDEEVINEDFSYLVKLLNKLGIK